MAQFRKDINALDQTTKTRYEVMMLDDNVTASGSLIDAFGRMRISQPYTLFDSVNRYEKNDKFDEATANNGTVTYNTFDSSISLNVANTAGDSVIRESKRVFTYQPGKSLLVMNTFSMAEANTNLIQRVGYFGANNGVFLESSNNEVYLVLRSQVTGSVLETKIPQSDWSVDKFDGTDDEYSTGTTAFASGLDITKSNIFWIQIEWLGVGDVTCGFVGDGKLIPAHSFKHPNRASDTTYMTTAILPVRYEISTVGNVTAPTSTLKQICTTVLSEGGYEKVSKLKVARDVTTKSVGTSFVPLVTIRLASDRLDSVILLKEFNILGIASTGSANFEAILVKNGTLANTSFDTSTFSNVDVDVSANTISGGEIFKVEYASATQQSRVPLNVDEGYNFDLQLGRTLAGTSDTITLAVRTLSGNHSAIGSLGFFDLTN
jgi:hypothetical protein